MKNKKLKTLLQCPGVKKIKSKQLIVITGGSSALEDVPVTCHDYHLPPDYSGYNCWSFQ